MKDSEMTILYSAFENGFFNTTDYGDSLPGDVVEISEGLWRELLAGISSGKVIAVENGYPVLTDPFIDYIALAEEKKNQLVNSAMQSISVIQLKLQAGRGLTDTERAKLNSTLDYIDAVTATDISTAPDVDWPVFPV